jgi:hypothetical protein
MGINLRSVVLVIVLFLSLISISQDSYAWLSGWSYRKPITINNTANSNNLTDYQVAINISYVSGKMNSDFSDLRFTNSTGALLSYWIESKVNSQWAYVWVKVDRIPASSTTTIYVYYGNTSIVTSQSNGTATFLFFDDFESYVDTNAMRTVWSDISINGAWIQLDNNGGYSGKGMVIRTGSGWAQFGARVPGIQIPQGAELRFRLRTVNAPWSFGCFGFSDQSSITNGDSCSGNNVVAFAKDTGSDTWDLKFRTKSAGTSTLTGTFSIPSGWAVYKVRWRSGYAEVLINNVSRAYSTTNIPSTSLYILLSGIHDGRWGTQYDYLDDVIVRKFTSPEPTTSIGAEESVNINQPPIITITSPSAQTYYTLTINFEFKATDDNSTTFHLKAFLNGNVEYDNPNYSNNTIVSFSRTLYGGHFNFTVWANDTQGASNSQTVLFHIFQGLNISVYNANGTILNGWNLLSKNSSSSVYLTNRNSPFLIEWNQLTQGNSDLTVNRTLFDSETKSFNISNTMGVIQVNYTLFRIQQWTSTNVDFSLKVSNSTYSRQYSSTNKTLLVSLRELPLGSVTETFLAFGHNIITHSHNYNLSMELNETITFSRTRFILKVFDENNVNRITKYRLTLIGNNSQVVKSLYVNKSSELAFLDDNTNTYDGISTNVGTRSQSWNYSYSNGLTLGNYSITYTISRNSGVTSTHNFTVEALNIFNNSFDRLFETTKRFTDSSNPPWTLTFTDYFTVNNTDGRYGINPLFRLTTVVTCNSGCSSTQYANSLVNEITLVSPYSYNKLGEAMFDFLTLNIEGDTRFDICVPNNPDLLCSIQSLYPKRTFFALINNATNTEIEAFLSQVCFLKNFLVFEATTSRAIGNALLSIYRNYENIQKIIAQEKSNDLGEAQICVQPNFLYSKMTVGAEGYNTAVFSPIEFYITPDSSKVFLSRATTNQTLNPLVGIKVLLSPTNNYISNDTMNPLVIRCHVDSNINSINFMFLNVTMPNGTKFSQYIYNPTGGEVIFNSTDLGYYYITCGYQLNNNGELLNVRYDTVIYYFMKSGLEKAGENLKNSYNYQTLMIIAIMISTFVTAWFIRYFGVASGFLFLLMLGFILTIFGSWGFNVQTGVYIFLWLIYIIFLLLKAGVI